MRLRVGPTRTGVVAVEATVDGVDVAATGIGFGARPDERYLGFGERSNAVDQRGNDVEVFVGEGPYQPEERPFIAGFVPPQGYHPRDDATYFPIPWLLSTAGYGFLLDNAETSIFHLTTERADVWSVEVAASRIAFRVFAGPRPADVLERFTARLGRQPPRRRAVDVRRVVAADAGHAGARAARRAARGRRAGQRHRDVPALPAVRRPPAPTGEARGRTPRPCTSAAPPSSPT